MKFSAKQYAIQAKDLLKGMLMGAGTATATVIQTSLDKGEFIFKWKLIGMVAAGAAATYVIRKFFVDDLKSAQKTIAQNQ